MAARCYVQRKGNGWVTDRAYEIGESERLARRAVELGKDDAVALCTGGFAIADVVDDLEDGDDFIDQALVLNPNLAWAWLFSGWVKISLGQPEAGIERVAHAMRLSPQDPHMFIMQAATAAGHFTADRYDEALFWAEKSVRAQPSFLLSVCLAAASNALAGQMGQAQKQMERIRHLAPALRMSNLKDMISYLRPEDIAKWANGLRKAGLPE